MEHLQYFNYLIEMEQKTNVYHFDSDQSSEDPVTVVVSPPEAVAAVQSYLQLVAC